MCEAVHAMKTLIHLVGTLAVLAAFLYGGALAGLPRIWLVDIGLMIGSFGVMMTGSAACRDPVRPEKTEGAATVIDTPERP